MGSHYVLDMNPIRGHKIDRPEDLLLQICVVNQEFAVGGAYISPIIVFSPSISLLLGLIWRNLNPVRAVELGMHDTAMLVLWSYMSIHTPDFSLNV